MRIVFLTNFFSEKMGYSDNFLPKAVAKLGHDVHIVTSNAQVYYGTKLYKDNFEPFLGPGLVECGASKLNGYQLHRLPVIKKKGEVLFKGLFEKLKSIKPDVVIISEHYSRLSKIAAFYKIILNYKFISECHYHISVFPPARGDITLAEKLKWFLYSNTIGRVFSFLCDACYPISSDAADIAEHFFGINSNKISISSLGTDTELFHPVFDATSQKQRQVTREKFGFKDSDIVCVYTGRFSHGKKTLCMAEAIASIHNNNKLYWGLFVGNGSVNDVEQIKNNIGCIVHDFIPCQDLPLIYRASDIAIWPAQESTSQLDAAACGLPLILSNRIFVKERIEGNGLLYEEGDYLDLAEKILSLTSTNKRKKLGEYGSVKMRKDFSWDKIARRRINDIENLMKK